MNSTAVLVVLLLMGRSPVAGAQDRDLALIGGRVYSSPTATTMDDTTVLIHNGTIVALGRRSAIKPPSSAQVIDCTGKIITAGFWNSHVHFQPGWDDAASAPSEKLEAHMQEMLTRWGFTTVWDLGSPQQNTLDLRKRVESGDVPGPRIFMAGPIFPKDGHPVYLPAELQLIEAATPAQAEQEALDFLQAGLDGVKLFAGAFMGNKPVVNMDVGMVKAASDVAHAAHKPVFSHPQDRTGLDNSLAGGVDVLAHTIPTVGFRYTGQELQGMKRRHVALIPTLTLWTTIVQDPQLQQRLVQSGVEQMKSYFSQGGTILFGTDVGFQSSYDPSQEYEYMGRGMSWRKLLATLTTNPSGFFKAADKGRVEKGMAADLVVLDGDPRKTSGTLRKWPTRFEMER